MIDASPDTQKNFAVIKQELLNTGMINSITRTMSPITDIWWRQPGPDYAGKPANQSIIISGETADIDFTKTMGIKILQGKDFSGTPSDSSAMLLNKAAVEAMGLKDPIGMQMRNGGIYAHTVIGVTDNVVMGSPFEPVDPMMVYFDPGAANSISIRLKASSAVNRTLGSIETIFNKYNPAYPFEYRFVDEEFGKKFIAEELVNKLTNIFAGLAIFICCIGLAGLASFTIEKRIREIGIRKVLGASVNNIAKMLSVDFLKLVLISSVIAFPIAWWAMHKWLEDFAYRVSISWWIFFLSGILALLIAVLTVGFQAIKAGVANPVKSLRTE